ncbi:aromatic motif membrane protein [Mycoplasma sp. 21DD0573]|uniref:aromatic motif membrane protein n=1 Tax=unclassified Mycoplasma TaxID=2683645 RepID=UPI002B1DDD77|nr:aromatic motif membrane protein [Mycoplasma sp. 21DD0573]MEA4276160.1 aromatic motif membrane protein [Mycoplasma sp. 21DD0573]
MKRLFKIKLLAPLLFLPTIALSCTNTTENTTPQVSKEKRPHQAFLKKLGSSEFINNSRDLNLYINTQNNIPDEFIKEIQSSLVYAQILNNPILENNIQIQDSLKASKTLEMLFRDNWFWYLSNLNKFNYYLNFYPSNFKDKKNDAGVNLTLAKYTKATQDGIKLNIDLHNYKLNKYVVKNIQLDSNSTLQSLDVIYIVLNENLILPVFKYSQEDKTYLKASAEILKVVSTDNIDATIDNLHSKLVAAHNKLLNDDIEYSKSINVEDLSFIYKNFDYAKFIMLFNSYNYFQRLYLALEEINQDNWQIIRYTLVGVQND